MSFEPVVTISEGQLRGKCDKDHNGGNYYSFHAIPYAKPPLGKLRFKAPQPPEPWTDIRDATKEGDECLSNHLIFLNMIGSEDCLILNVFTPELPSKTNNRLRPVMFWIHGGAFTAGSSKVEMYGPDFLITEDVVVVSINYRLGALGFLSLEDQSLGVPGNAGLKDMVMALKWTQRNIKAFNGDPNNVTIFGESAGGAAVHYLMLSPMAKGLFHRAIAQSGCALNLWAVGTRCGLELSAKLGFNSTDERAILDALQSATKEEVFAAQLKIKDPISARNIRPFGPVVEKSNGSEPSFLPDEPINIIMEGKYNKVPLLIGYNTREGMLYEMVEKRFKISQKITDWEYAVPFNLNCIMGTPMSKGVGNWIKRFYYGDEEPSPENIDKYYQLQTDTFFFRGIYSTVKNHLATSDSPIYLYRFGVDTNLNVFKTLGDIKNAGACHADELGYLFKMSITPEFEPASVQDVTIRRMCRFWANFSRNGNPNEQKASELIPITWPATSSDKMQFMNIEEKLSIECNPEQERMQFWDKIYGMDPTSKL